MTATVFALAFAATAGRLVDLNLADTGMREKRVAATPNNPPTRGNIFDRNGVLLATSLPTASLVANPRQIIDPEKAAASLAGVVPGSNTQEWLAQLTRDVAYVRLRRNLTPRQQDEVNDLGIPGVDFRESSRRVYPQARTAAHVLGLTSNEHIGIAGVEQAFDGLLSQGHDIRLSLDVGVQTVVRDELSRAMRTHNAIGGAGLIIDVHTGEVLASVSMPDFDPNAPIEADDPDRFNRVTKGVYELGSPFKLITAAIAIDARITSLDDGYDATHPIRVARFTISDFHAKKRWLSVPEVVMHSSNIGAAKMAQDVGPDLQRQYFERFGLMGSARIELPEVGRTLVPKIWRPVNGMTASFGYGIAVTPLHMTRALTALVNGGTLVKTTLLKHEAEELPVAPRVISAATSRQIRSLMRLVVSHGTGSRADYAGYFVGGKTGTAEKLIAGKYEKLRLLSSFTGAFPIDNPKYAIFVMLDEPKGTRETQNYATGGWVAAPVVGKIVGRAAPMLGLPPAQGDLEEANWHILAPNDAPWAGAMRQAIFRAEDARIGAY